MLKIIASAVIVLGGGYIGLLFSSRLGARVKQIEQIRLAITQTGFNISFLKMPLSKALMGASGARDGVVGKIFKFAATEIAEAGLSPSSAFERAVLTNRGSLCITAEDTEILSEFAQNLGKGDVESEINNINATCAKLCLAQERAEGEFSERGKLWRGMGLLGGMLVVILLF